MRATVGLGRIHAAMRRRRGVPLGNPGWRRTDSTAVLPLYRSQTQCGGAPLDSGSVDLSEYVGQTVELLFTTTAGPKGGTCAAWAGWGDPHFNGDAAAKPAFRQVYDHEIKIYEYSDRK